MRIGTFRDTLAAVDPSLPIRYDNRAAIGPLMSWRGDYSEATLTPSDGNDALPTVADVLARLDEAIEGCTYHGYKGGKYVYDRDTALWADDYGDCDYWTVDGIAIVDGVVVVQRRNIEEYR